MVNVSSTAGRVARPGSSVYNLTKFGVNAFSEALRQELSATGFGSAWSSPAPSIPSWVDHVAGDVQAAARKQVAAIEALLPEDIADAVAYIVTRDRRVAVNEMLVRAATRPGNATRPGTRAHELRRCGPSSARSAGPRRSLAVASWCQCG